jgi:hypothetical protein
MNRLTTLCASAPLIAAAFALSACSASKALESPPQKNFGVLEPGVHRDLVRAELGNPQESVAGADCDVFSFAEGSTGWKYLRALGYSVLDIGTLGIAEVYTLPVETTSAKTPVQVRVCYAEQRVVFSERLEAGNPGPIITGAMPKTAASEK